MLNHIPQSSVDCAWRRGLDTIMVFRSGARGREDLRKALHINFLILVICKTSSRLRSYQFDGLVRFLMAVPL